jgi:lipopolysaccharide transport system ATP-binding protein
MPIAIKIENLSKQYRLGLVSTRTLSHDLNRWWQTSILGKDDPYLKIGESPTPALPSREGVEKTKENPGVHSSSPRGGGREGAYIWALRDINLEVYSCNS